MRLSSLFTAGCALLVFAFATPAVGGDTPSGSKVLVEGEELTYNVRYGFIDLGQVRIKVVNKVVSPAFVAYKAKAYIDSYPKLPFVDLHATFESLIDSTMHSRAFTARVKDGKYWDYARYRFEYDQKRVITEVGHRDTVVQDRDTLSISSFYQDGLSLFFYAREQVLSGRKINVPTVIKETKASTYIDFFGKRTSVEVDAIEYPVDVIEFEGTANFVGIFGLTGGFEGWFSNDEARIPILAKMKVILGSVTVELMEWKRVGWAPPKAEAN